MPRSDTCGQHLFVHAAGSTAYVLPISRAQYRLLRAARQQETEEKPLNAHRAYEHVLETYPDPGEQPEPTHVASKPTAVVCPNCGTPIRRLEVGGGGWTTKRCEASTYENNPQAATA